MFGFFWVIEPQRNNEVILTYTLPGKILDDVKNDNYSLFIQKQSGQRDINLEIELNFDSDKIKNWYTSLKTDSYFQ